MMGKASTACIISPCRNPRFSRALSSWMDEKTGKETRSELMAMSLTGSCWMDWARA